jgi:predicted RNA-binding protein with PUA domain
VGTCPECECEFEDPIEVCPHCNVPLVAREEQVGQSEEDDVDGDLPAEGLVVIEATDDDDRIGELRELLEESGIPCFLSNELSPTEQPPDETKVLIPKEMAGDARKLIRDFSC